MRDSSFAFFDRTFVVTAVDALARIPAWATLAMISLISGCGKAPPLTPPAGNEAPLPVHVAEVRALTAPVLLSVPGTVRPAERAGIAARVSGTIVELPVVLGQTVARGELLVRLAAPELAARAAQARVQLEQAEREAQRTRDLAARGADTADAAKAAAERLSLARAALAEAEAMLGFAEIRAPFAGHVSRRPAYPGDLATPGQLLIELERVGPLVVEAAFPSSLAAPLTRETVLAINIAGVDQSYACRILEIAAAADPATRTVLVKLALPVADAGLSGRYAAVEVPTPESVEHLLAPASAVSPFGQMERVFVIENGLARLRLVKTGAMRGDEIELLAGVAAGERIVAAPPATLRDAQPVIAAP